MAMFQYTGRTRRGEAVSGQLDAVSPDAVAAQLMNNGITPVDINAAVARVDVAAGLRAWRARLAEGNVELVDQIFFCRQMYTLLRAGVPIMQALRGLRDTTRNAALARVIGSIGESLDAGLDLSSAFRRHEDKFSSLFISMVQIGETTGSLAESFLQLAQYLEREKDTRDRVKQALRYPVFVLVAIVAALVVINLFVIPAFAKVYAGFKAELPWATQILIGTSNFMVRNWPWLLAGVIAAVFGVRAYLNTTEGRYRWHRLKLRLPLVGRVITNATLSRFARSLAVTLRAGVSLVPGMTVVARAVDNDYVGERIVQMRDGIERGETITRTALTTGLFPPLVIQMLSVGENTGLIDDLLVEVADYYDREVDYDLKNLSSAIEPILITVIGVIVLILALGVFLPLWDLAKAARGG